MRSQLENKPIENVKVRNSSGAVDYLMMRDVGGERVGLGVMTQPQQVRAQVAVMLRRARYDLGRMVNIAKSDNVNYVK